MIANPQPGDRIVTGKECRVVTRVLPKGAIEYDLLEMQTIPFDALTGETLHMTLNGTIWRKIAERICDPIVWSYYSKQEGKLL